MTPSRPPYAHPEKLNAAADYLEQRFSIPPKLAIILGSGLSYFANRLNPIAKVAATQIPGYPAPTVKGHAGQLSLGKVSGQPVLAIQGRSHYYEGKSLEEITFPVQLIARLGITRLVLTNAAGGINPDYDPGDFILLTDYINFTQIELFPDQSPGNPFTPALRRIALDTARQQDILLREGVYCWTSGPSYETAAEIKVLQKLGGDAVGMSTVPEALMAAALGLQTVGISLITNYAAGIGSQPLTHSEVQETAAAIKVPYSEFIYDLIANIIRKK